MLKIKKPYAGFFYIFSRTCDIHNKIEKNHFHMQEKPGVFQFFKYLKNPIHGYLSRFTLTKY